MIEIILNGEKEKITRKSLTIAELIELKKTPRAQYVSVEVNNKIIPREKFTETQIKNGDQIEFIYYMGGGSGLDFDEEEIERYSRHIILNEVGGAGQKKIKNAKVLIIGAGGLGAPALLYLAAAGVGTLGIVDADVVDLTNLQRQVIHFTPDLKKPKVESAAEKIRQINPHVKIKTYQELFLAKNAFDILDDYDVVLDGTDNFPAKFLINDACVMRKKPLSHGGILRFEGQTITIVPDEGPCYRCIFEEPPPPGLVPSCREAGILGAVAGVLGTIQATEILKLILGVGEPLIGKLLRWNALTQEFRKLNIQKNPACPLCGENPTITKLADYEPPTCKIG